MALSLANIVIGKEMERVHQQPSTTRRTERKIIEKNRRTRMKHLYSVLNSLLPSQPSDQEAKSLPDQIDDAIRHIKGLETAVKEAKDKKENLMGKKRPSSSSCTSSSTSAALKAPQIEIRVRDSSLEVILVSGLHDQFIFSEILRMLHEEKVEVLNANFSVVGNSAYHLVHAKIGESGLGTATISERLTTFVNGSATDGGHEEFQPKLWDCGLSPNIWNF
ncbi:transcription factor bHLH162-like [Rhodamnia argentea]|uniref:Transcription factor bHLH162-like n=1 Tax=Rhodamnia argentea TaxID=178133 RepID=A0A8B8QSL4_9MYRT|nr:transcription factor bHLH162-like [Rhodamnia argentea]